MLPKKEKIAVIIPVYNEESCLGELMNRLLGLRNKMSDVQMEFIFVDDGSSDRSWLLLSEYAGTYPFVKAILLSRNFGHQMALTAGIDYADADYVAVIDADLQDPPELIEQMYRKAKDGYDVVYGKRIERKGETFFKKFTAKAFYRLINMLTKTEIPSDTGDFRLMSRRVAEALRSLREHHRFIRGMVPWVGFLSTPVHYERDIRHAGVTKYPLRKMLKFALDAIFSFSNVPLRIATYSGLFIVAFGISLGAFMLYIKLFTSLAVPGLTVTLLTVVILGGMQILMLGVIGEYVGRIFEESKRRPLYIVRETRNLE